MLISAAVDVGLTLIALFLATEVRLILPLGQDLVERFARLSWQVYVFAGVIWLFALSQFNLYTRRWARFRDEWGVLTVAVLTALLILAGALYLSFRQVSRLQFIYFGMFDLALLTIAHAALDGWLGRSSRRDAWRVLIAGTSQSGRSLITRLHEQPSSGVQIVGFLADTNLYEKTIDGLPVIGALEQVIEIVQREQVSEVVLALPNEAYEKMLAIIMALEQLPVQVSLVPDVLDLAWFMTRVDELNGVPLLRLRESPLNGPARALKRLMDIVLSFILLVLTSPIMLVTALAVRLDSPGPALIRQKRVGENGEPFNMLKFRTMFAGAETVVPNSGEQGSGGAEEQESTAQRETRIGSGIAAYKRPDDPRVTSIGQTLRHYSIDELPQLVNVLRGEMSLVGPRPELPWLVDCYEPWQRHRFAVPPGMTGWWQIHGRSDRPMHLNVEDDLYYIRNYSLWMDVQILLRTIPVVLSGRGAY
jgi:exopolysaccharide biosynthesis polyprenyl glycosylphosphotransferase